MERHGHGRKTFTIETNADGNAVVHHVNGQFGGTYYHQGTHGKVITELSKQFDASKNIYMVVIELVSAFFENGAACGNASNVFGETGGGYTVIPASGHCVTPDSNVGLVAHELGHNFGLPHDFRSDHYIMSYGGHLRSVFSTCAAGWLTAHPYLNASTNQANQPTTIEMLKAEAESLDTIRFQFKISDPDGLHQARLVTYTTAVPGAIGQGELLTCQPLKGNKSTTLDFVTTELTVRGSSEIRLDVMDMSGNQTSEGFPIESLSIKGPKIEGPWLWAIVSTGWQGGADAANSGIDYLAEATDDAVTETEIATNGATAGETVGSSVWTLVKITPTGKNNISETATAVGSGITNIDNAVIYGSLKLESPKEQDTLMFAGSDDAVKVWLNGELVHNNPIDRGATDYQDYFSVTLKEGENVLLVAVYEKGGDWSGFFGFHKDAVYTVVEIEGVPVATPKIPGPKIEGPWLWTIAPTGWRGGANAAASGIDYLAEATDDAVTETEIATNGATAGESVGNSTWTLGNIAPRGGDNITELAHTLDLGSGDIDNHVAYGSLRLWSPLEQPTTMYVGSDDAVKVWLNGELVHNNPVDRGASDYQEVFPVTLKQGTNALLVAIYEKGGGWSGFFGFEKRAEYMVLRPIGASNPQADVNEDGQVDASDLLLVVTALGGNTPTTPRADVNGDGAVDVNDLVIVIQNLDELVDTAAPTIRKFATHLQPALLEAQLETLRAKSDGTLKYQRAIAFFQSLLTIAHPDKTVLLANYPNPFNPETWIPYQLAQDSKVSITIYDARGIPVRQLTLGYRPAGDYTDRTRAAYWDGKNTQGEPVASGLYFYQLQTDTLSLLRKMVVKK